MVDVCLNCHNQNFIDGFYQQYDGLLQLYHEKFASPGLEPLRLGQTGFSAPAVLPTKLNSLGLKSGITKAAAHAMAPSMMGPDITHWHGTYEVARNFYSEYIPELQDLAENNLKSNDATKAEAR